MKCLNEQITFTKVYFCTLEKGHTGDHMCYNNFGKPTSIWENEEERDDDGDLQDNNRDNS